MNDSDISALRRLASGKLIGEFSPLVHEWSLSNTEQKQLLGGCTIDYLRRRFNKDNHLVLSESLTERMVLLVSIRGDIQILYPDIGSASLIRIPNPYFNNMSTLDKMLNGGQDGIRCVQKYLKSSIVGGYL